MSDYENSISAFCQVLDDKSDLLSTQDWADLHQRMINLSDDTEEIIEEIDQWLESHPEISTAYDEQLRKASTDSSVNLNNGLGVANSKSPTPANQQSPAAKDMIINHILRHSPPSTPQTNPPNTQGSN
ncbi:hypothetical protein MC7420_7016 [Coleofasciculus chthonoplastes PCC 7420]|uniref:Uncharacterized protein n=1 Tax=Coleofasciculus chthonoplastes PCC 7420 TaxID=118168 RepID=B4VIA0_9CYAN|nr:hypothetical protein [Coleofasciculus chthonoplastes]EDX78363.1 hypothetical protein MC7420_7016 [Coleofasciculus chthonoplastes PCC 7420]